jgi:hypothetical protein
MADQLQLRGGTTTEHATFTGALREVTVDTDKDTVVVHDNATAGGHPLLREDLSNLPAGTIDNADINANAAIDLSKLATGALPTAITVASDNIVDGTIVNADVSASAAIAGTKISPNFGNQNVVTTGTSTAASLIPTGSSVPTNGVYLPAANSVGISTNGTARLNIASDGKVGLGTGSPGTRLDTRGFTSYRGNAYAIASFAANDTLAPLNICQRENGTDPAISAGQTSAGSFASLALMTSEKIRLGINTTGGASFSSDAGEVPVVISIGAIERARIDGSGRLLVGTSTNIASGSFQVGTTTGTSATTAQVVGSNAASAWAMLRSNAGAIVANNNSIGTLNYGGFDGSSYLSAAAITAEVDGTPGANDMPGRLVFSTTADGANAPTERMRITNDGRVYIGHTTSTGLSGTISPLGYIGRSGYTGGSFTNIFNIAWTGAAANLWIDSTNFGAIQVVSDYRIKQNVQTQTAPAIERIKLLRPVTYELKNFESLFQADGIQREGFIAHEVQEVIPSGAEGQKDEENRVQSLRLDAIVSVLTKALQEAVDKIEILEAKVAILEAS